MRKLLAAAIGLTMLTPLGARAGLDDYEIKILNDMSQDIVNVYAKCSDDRYWSRDLLSGIIEPARSLVIDISNGTGNCRNDRVDVYVKLRNGDTRTRSRMDITTVSDWKVR